MSACNSCQAWVGDLENQPRQREPALDRLTKGSKRCLAVSRTAGGLCFL